MALELKNVVRRVGMDTHIHDTTIGLERGGFNILLGPTLSGKTTLMLLMAGLEQPASGEVWFGGRNVTGVPVQKRNVSMVYQQFINYPNLTVFENIASPLRVAGVARAEITKRVNAIAELLRLTPMLDRRPLHLSGGQQQRTALARALVKDAELVLLDEPLANLDYKLREELREELPRLFADRDCVVVYATTEPSEALLLGGKTATLHQGRVTQFGDTLSLYRHPADLTTARIFSDPPINTANIRKLDSEFILTDHVRWPARGPFRDLPEGTYIVGIRPHHITPAETSPNAVSIEGRVLVAELSGSESIVHFEVEEGTWVSQSQGVHPLKVGQRARLHIDVAHCLYFDHEHRLIAAPSAASEAGVRSARLVSGPAAG
ncbi:MAG: ABC transporter ATP-binding protein [Propylenella sp.]